MPVRKRRVVETDDVGDGGGHDEELTGPMDGLQPKTVVQRDSLVTRAGALA
jgi:hypothetical protein